VSVFGAMNVVGGPDLYSYGVRDGQEGICGHVLAFSTLMCNVAAGFHVLQIDRWVYRSWIIQSFETLKPLQLLTSLLRMI
jgi:hypothetical protein